MALWIKKDPTTWVSGTKIWVKTSPTQWVPATRAWIKKTATEWAQFWPGAGPTIEFPLEISASSTSWPSTLTGKNYHWENASTLSYKFQSSLTNTTDDSAWTDLMSYTTIANPVTGNFNTQTFSITSANFSPTVRSKWFRFVVKGTDSSTGTITTEVSNNVNISKSALVGTAGTVVIARSSASSYIYSVTNNGTWSSTPVSYSYQWQQLLSGTWTDIAGATSISKDMTSFVQKDVRCQVYAVDDLGATSQLPITSNSLFVDYAPPSVTSFTATGGVSKITYSYVVASDNQFPTITLKIERLQSGGSYLQTNFVNLTPKTGTNVIESITLSGTYRATLTASDGINPDSSIVVNNLTVANLNRTNVTIAQTTTNLSGASNITFSKTGIGSSQTGVIGWTNGSGLQYSDVSWSGNYSGSDLNKTISGATQSSSFALSAATGTASITATVVQKAIPQATISWDQTNAQSYRVTYRATATIAPGGFVDTIVYGNSSAASVSLIINQSYATVKVLEVVVYEYPNQNSGQPTGSSMGFFEPSPIAQVTLGATQDFSISASGTITYTYPTISGISVSNTTPFPSSATSISVSNTAPSNTGTATWANGSNTSVANLFSVSGSGSGGAGTNPSSLLTSGSFTVVSTGTASATIRAINTSITVHATWTQANAQSYRVLYTTNAVGGTQTLNGNSSSTNPLALIGASANSFTLQSVTVYPELNQGGTGVTLASTASTSGATRVTDTSGSGSVTYTAPATAPVNTAAPVVTPSSGTAGSTTYSSTTGTWTGNPTPTYTYQWQYNDGSSTYLNISGATSSSYSPPSNFFSGLFYASPIRCRVTATNSAAPSGVQANSNTVTVSPVIPTITMGANSGITQTSGTINWTSTGQASFSSSGTISGTGSTGTSVTNNSLSAGTTYTGTVTVTSSTGNQASANYSLTTSLPQYTVTWNANGGTGGGTTGPFNSNVAHTAPAVSRSGYTFNGYFDSPSGTSSYGPVAVGTAFFPPSTITMYARWTIIPVASVTSISGSTGGRNASLSWVDPKATMVYVFSSVTSATARIQRSADNATWTSGATESLTISSNSATQTTNQPLGNTSTQANFYYRAQVISLNGTTLGTPITSASILNSVTPKNSVSLYP